MHVSCTHGVAILTGYSRISVLNHLFFFVGVGGGGGHRLMSALEFPYCLYVDYVSLPLLLFSGSCLCCLI